MEAYYYSKTETKQKIVTQRQNPLKNNNITKKIKQKKKSSKRFVTLIV